MVEFINGLNLSERFFFDIAKPILDKYFPDLVYSSGLIGYGSDVLGFDDVISTDHMWGPRFYMFVSETDIALKEQLFSVFSKELPYTYEGYSVNFSKPNMNDSGVRHPEYITKGLVSPLIFIQTLNVYLDSYLGVHDFDTLSMVDWLALSEHRLLSLTSGKIFVDNLDINKQLSKIRFYPDHVRLFLIASNWSLIAEEQAFVKRCFDVGDEIGSVLVCARIAERLMRLAFLYCNMYAPYSKWFGKAFKLLPIQENIKFALHLAVIATNIEEREKNIVLSQKLLADLHNSLKITEFIDIKIERYFGRDIKVIFADKLAESVKKKLSGTLLENCPLIGSLSEVSNFTIISDSPDYQAKIRALYLD